MGSVHAVRIDDELRQRLVASPRPAASVRRLLLPAALPRGTVALLDAAQVVLLAVVLAPPNGQPAHALGLGLLVAGLALLIRRSFLMPVSYGPEATRRCALRAAAAAALAVSAVAGSQLLLDGSVPHVAGFAAWALLSASLAAGLRLGAAWLGVAAMNIAVVGPPEKAAALADALVRRGRSDLRIVARLRDANADDLRTLDELVRTGRVNLVALADLDPDRAAPICERLADSDVRVCLGLNLEALYNHPFSGIRAPTLPLLDLMPQPINHWRGAAKRAFDVTLVLLTLPIIAPVLIAAAVAIRLESPGPALFRQWRFGLGSQPTEVFKFRTMYVHRGDATGEQRTLARDPRVTRVGRILRRTSIDELPQLLNVLRGDMSLVGPRPHPTHMKIEGTYYFEAVKPYRARHRVKPGITGWAQINGSRGEVDTLAKAQRRVELDLWYIANWSPALDAWIVIRTAFGGFATLGAD